MIGELSGWVAEHPQLLETVLQYVLRGLGNTVHTLYTHCTHSAHTVHTQYTHCTHTNFNTFKDASLLLTLKSRTFNGFNILLISHDPCLLCPLYSIVPPGDPKQSEHCITSLQKVAHHSKQSLVQHLDLLLRVSEVTYLHTETSQSLYTYCTHTHCTHIHTLYTHTLYTHTHTFYTHTHKVEHKQSLATSGDQQGRDNIPFGR